MSQENQTPEPAEKKSFLTHRKKLFARGLAMGKSGVQAAKDAGYPKSTALHGSSRIANDPAVKIEVERLLDLAGASEAECCKVIGEAMKAKKKDKADHDLRLKGADRSLRLRGLLDRENSSPIQTTTQIIIAIREERQRRGLPPLSDYTNQGPENNK